MIKAKLILSIIGISSIIGGILAFKSQHKFNGRFICLTSSTYRSIGVRYTFDDFPNGAKLYCSALIDYPKRYVLSEGYVPEA